MKNTRIKHTAEFKARVALEAVREQASVPDLAKRFKIHANQIYKWKQEFVQNAARAFSREAGAVRSDTDSREGEPLRKIGELTVERDFLSKGLGRLT
jgi:transposase